MQGLSAYGSAASGGKFKAPVMQRADRLPLLDPAMSHRSRRMRTVSEQNVNLAVIIEDCKAQSIHFQRKRTPVRHVRNSTYGHEFRHERPRNMGS